MPEMYLVSPCFYMGEWSELDFCSVGITRRALLYTSGVPTCTVKTAPDNGGSRHRNMSKLK
jgi:hypothetical protein